MGGKVLLLQLMSEMICDENGLIPGIAIGRSVSAYAASRPVPPVQVLPCSRKGCRGSCSSLSSLSSRRTPARGYSHLCLRSFSLCQKLQLVDNAEHTGHWYKEWLQAAKKCYKNSV